MTLPDPALILAGLPLRWSAASLLPEPRPEIARILEVWRAAAAEKRFPGRATFGPAQLRPVLPHVHVYAIASREPLRFVIRLIGTRMTEHIGRNLAGKPVEEVPMEQLRLVLTAILGAVIAAEVPIHIKAPRAIALPNGDSHALESIWLPCAEDGETIDRVIAISLLSEVD